MVVWSRLFFLLILLFPLSHSRNSNSPKVLNYRQLEKRILDRILSPRIYDSQIRPKGAGNTTEWSQDGPTRVMVNLYVRSFEKIDDVKMEFSVQITFRQQWNDNRLAFNSIGGKIKYLTMTECNKVWMPDTFFRNEKEGKFHSIIQPNLYVRVFPNGDVLYSIRVSLTLACPMDLKLFPLDTQTCHLTIASYGWTSRDLQYIWSDHQPVQFVSNLFLPGGFELAHFDDSKCDVETATGVYSCLSVDMMFKRQLSYYVFTIYVPTFMTVCVSWMSFWLDHKESFFLTDIFRYLEQEKLFSTILIDKNESFADVVRPGAGDVDHHHSTGHVHHHLQYQQLPPARRLH